MFMIEKDPVLQERNIFFAWLEAVYPEPAAWNTEAFYGRAEETIAAMKQEFSDYDRKAVFSGDPYFRFFRKFKKTYPVMLQFESVLHDRPFPHGNPVAEVPFLFELSTRMLSGTHDIDCTEGTVRLCSAAERESFTGIHGGEAHCYPNDVIGRDDGGIILSMISGADDRTCCHPDSRHVFYPVFGTPDMPAEKLLAALDRLEEIVLLLAPDAAVSKHII